LVSREHRLFMRAQGIESNVDFIDYKSLPLMRNLLCLALIVLISFLCFLVSQFLFYLWFIYSIIGLWHALIPLSVIMLCYLLYLYLIEAFSLKICVLCSLSVLELVSYHFYFHF
jgi:hypothetical protein